MHTPATPDILDHPQRIFVPFTDFLAESLSAAGTDGHSFSGAVAVDATAADFGPLVPFDLAYPCVRWMNVEIIPTI